jgi:hypothetical protein
MFGSLLGRSAEVIAEWFREEPGTVVQSLSLVDAERAQGILTRRGIRARISTVVVAVPSGLGMATVYQVEVESNLAAAAKAALSQES